MLHLLSVSLPDRQLHPVRCTSPGLPTAPIAEQIRSKDRGVSCGHHGMPCLALLHTPSMTGPRHTLDVLPQSLQPMTQEPAVQTRKHSGGTVGNEVGMKIMYTRKVHRRDRRCSSKAQGSNPSSSETRHGDPVCHLNT